MIPNPLAGLSWSNHFWRHLKCIPELVDVHIGTLEIEEILLFLGQEYPWTFVRYCLFHVVNNSVWSKLEWNCDLRGTNNEKKYQSLLMKIAGFITHQTFSRNITCRNDINSERIRVPEGVWTHNPPWSSRTLQPLSYSNWRLSLWWNNLISRYNFFALVGETVCSLRYRIKFVLTTETG